MLRSRSVLVILLLLLLEAFSFNAYACLFATSPNVEDADMRDCPQQQSPRQVCDAFTTMGAPTSPELNPAFDSQALCPEDAISLAPAVSFPERIGTLPDHPPVSSREVLVDTIVLRL